MRAARYVVGGFLVAYFGIAIFERLAPRRVIKSYWRVVNPVVCAVAGIVPGMAVVETTGRRTGRRHHVPVGGRLRSGSFWFVAGHARKSDYVRNMVANPRVRVRIHGRWRNGTAQVLPNDDARRRAVRLTPLNGLFLWTATTDLLTIRVDLD